MQTLTQTEDEQWEATWFVAGEKITQVFDAVLLATGKFAKPYIPAFAGVDSVEYIHSAQFKAAEDFSGKTVLVVGSSFSGVSIAEALATDPQVTQVKQLIRTTRRLGVKYYSVDPEHDGPTLPRDIFFNRTQLEALAQNPQKRNAVFTRLCGDQESLSAWKVPEGMIPKLTITEGRYRELARAGKIEATRGEIDRFEVQKVFLRNDPNPLTFDVVIFCTGYHNKASYLPEDLQALSEDDFYLKTFPPGVPNIAYCGTFKQTFAPHTWIVELQAQLAMAYFTKKWLMPESDVIASTPSANEANVLIDQLEMVLGIHPQQHRASLTPHERLLLLSPRTPWESKLRGPGSNPACAAQAIEKLMVDVCCERVRGHPSAQGKLAHLCLQWLKQSEESSTAADIQENLQPSAGDSAHLLLN